MVVVTLLYRLTRVVRLASYKGSLLFTVFGFLEVREAVSRDDALCGDSSNGKHGQSSVQQFLIDHFLVFGIILGLEIGQSKV